MISINGIELKPTIFPDGTSQVWKLDPKIKADRNINIIWNFKNEGEFMHLAQAVQLIRSMNPNAIISLDVPYMPYARQDKEISNDACFALYTFASLLNTLKINKMTGFDPHSDVVTRLFSNYMPTFPVGAVKELKTALGTTHMCYPDEGAFKKYHKLFVSPYIHGIKERDQATGKITSYTLDGGDPSGKSILIVDDIADGGATFVTLAEMLRKGKAAEVNLFVSHGLFSKGTQILRDAGIKRIFTREGEVK